MATTATDNAGSVVTTPAPEPTPTPRIVTLAEAQAWAVVGLVSARACMSPARAAALVRLSLAQHWPKGQ